MPPTYGLYRSLHTNYSETEFQSLYYSSIEIIISRSAVRFIFLATTLVSYYMQVLLGALYKTYLQRQRRFLDRPALALALWSAAKIL